MAKIKDTDYLTVSARIRAMETRLLTKERMEQMVEARSNEDAVKILTESGYGELPALTRDGMDELIGRARKELYKDLKRAVPDSRLVEVFQIKYDYHNAKVLLKAEAMDVDGDRLLMEGGRWSAGQMRDAFRRDTLRDFSAAFRSALTHARETLSAGGDPQLSDFILDKAYFEEMCAAAADTKSPFLIGYVRILIDAVNLRSVVRAGRMDKGVEFLRKALVPGGNVEISTLTGLKRGDLADIYRSGFLADAASMGDSLSAPGSGVLTAFERACDDAVTKYLTQAKLIPFGEQAVISYLYARENEFTAIRTILSGRMAGLSGEIIRERLREAYV